MQSLIHFISSGCWRLVGAWIRTLLAALLTGQWWLILLLLVIAWLALQLVQSMLGVAAIVAGLAALVWLGVFLLRRLRLGPRPTPRSIRVVNARGQTTAHVTAPNSTRSWRDR